MRKTTWSLLAAGLAASMVLVPAIAALAADDISSADPRYRLEVSDDGLTTVEFLVQVEDAPRGSGSAIFGTAPDWGPTLRRQVGGLAVRDMNGDGLADVVAGCYISQSFPPYDDWENMIYFNTGTELEASPSWVSADEVSTGDIQVADINGDTYPDVFAANGGTSNAASVIYYGSPTGPSTTPGWSEGVSRWTNYAKAFDIDHDGDLDVATANQFNSQTNPFRPVHVFFNDDGVLATMPGWSSSESSIQNFIDFGDLNGDGWEDLAVSKWINWESAVYLSVPVTEGGEGLPNSRTFELVPSWTTGETGDDRGIGWADVDGDMDPDLALGHDPTQLFTNDSGALSVTWTASGSFFGQQDMTWHDVDNDGDPDLTEAHFANGVVNIYLNEGGVLASTPSWSYDSSAVGTAVAYGDINGDGFPDLVYGNSGDVSIMVFYNQLGGAIFADGFESEDTSAWSGSAG